MDVKLRQKETIIIPDLEDIDISKILYNIFKRHGLKYWRDLEDSIPYRDSIKRCIWLCNYNFKRDKWMDCIFCCYTWNVYDFVEQLLKRRGWFRYLGKEAMLDDLVNELKEETWILN